MRHEHLAQRNTTRAVASARIVSGVARAFYIAAFLTGLAVPPPPARADSESCANAQADGQHSLRQGRVVAAQAAFERCARDACPSPIRQDCARSHDQLEARRSSIVVSVVDERGRELSNAMVETDSGLGPARADGRSFIVEPGAQVLLVSAPGRKSLRQAISVREGERDQAVRVVLAPAVNAWLDVRPPTYGPNLAADLTLGPGRQRVVERRRRLQLATYGLTAAGLAVGSWALASGVRGQKIDHACDSVGSCSEGYAAHGRMLYRSADAGAVIGGLCGISAAVLLWHWLTMSSSETLASASARDDAEQTNPPRPWRLVF